MDLQSPVEFVSFNEELINMMISFIKYVIENYTSIKPGKDLEIVASIGTLYLNNPRYTTIVVDSPTISNSSVFDPNMFGTKKYGPGEHLFLTSGNFSVHCISENEILSHRLASLLYSVSVAKEILFTKYGFSDLKPISIGSTIILNSEEVESPWFDVPINFSYTASLALMIKKVTESEISKIVFDLYSPTKIMEIHVNKEVQ